MSLSKKLLFTLIFTIFSVVLAVGALFSIEIFWRTVAPVPFKAVQSDYEVFPYRDFVVTTHPRNLVLGNSHHPMESFFRHGACDKEDGTTAIFNSFGFRSPEFAQLPPKGKDEVRIILTGGSAALSWNVGERCTFDNRILAHLKRQFPNKRVTVFNLASGAWKSFQELIALQHYGLKLEPDLIIAFDGFNDIQHAFMIPQEEAYGNYQQRFSEHKTWLFSGTKQLFQDLKIIYALKKVPRYLKAKASSHLEQMGFNEVPMLAAAPQAGQLATQFKEPMDFNAIYSRTDFDPLGQNVVDEYLRNISLMAKAAESVQAKFVVALQPTLYLKNPLSKDEQQMRENYLTTINFVVQGYMRMQKGLTKLAKQQQNMQFVDFSNAFNGLEDAYLQDYCHLDAKGYALLADKLVPILQQQLS